MQWIVNDYDRSDTNLITTRRVFMRQCSRSVSTGSAASPGRSRRAGHECCRRSSSCRLVDLGCGGRGGGGEPGEQAAQGREPVVGEAGAETPVDPDDGGEQPVEHSAAASGELHLV